ncbi:peptidoglycan recognition protein [Anoplophora glabripennis]|uniref:peptidoglycan recognition protein n=1 Tax=Anoplophora glabripennis TaxID=217634 RepID=UPI000874A797|nr:peptidoglycan recognition protein [Anoplophora glabripennis]
MKLIRVNSRHRQAVNVVARNQKDSKKDNLTIYCFRLLYVNKDIIRNATIALAICLACLIITLILTQNLKHVIDDHDYNYTEHNYGTQLGKHKVYYRSAWGGKTPKINTKPLQHPVHIIIISHTSTYNCNTTEKCCMLIREVQMKHFAMPFRSVDIGYNFMIGGDGNIYVGRGWDIQNFHRKISIGINFIGDFNYDDFTEDMRQAAKELIKQGLELKKLSEDYIIVGENQTNSRMYVSPGANVYKVIKHWPHFYNRTLF